MKKILNAVFSYIRQTDLVLILFTLLATGYGFLLVYSAKGSGRTSLIQGIGVALGLIVMVILSKTDYHDIAKLWKYIAAACVLLFILTLILGKSRAGSQDRSWIWIGPVTVQPAEFVKVAFAVTFPMHCELVKENINAPRNIALLTLHAAVPICFLILQKDMGMTLVFAMMFVIMMFMANVKLRYFVGAFLLVLAAAPLIWNKILGATQKYRILALFNPVKYAANAYQQTQGRSALGSGELFGYGLFHGPITQGASYLLPEKQNDMIFAVAGEEFGFVGCILILLIFAVLLFRILSTARKSKDSLGMMICIGVFASFTVQSLINIAAVLMIFPITGISLPFFSSGGSSILSCLMAIGLVLSVYMHKSNQLFAGREME